MCIESISYVRTSVGAAGGIQPWVTSKVRGGGATVQKLRVWAVVLLTVALLSLGIRF
jgi:hypothetical protein